MQHKALGGIFLLFGLAGGMVNVANATPYYIVWFCNHTVFVLGVALFCKSRSWITAQVSLGLVPQMIWSLDFLSKLFFDTYIFDITQYMFDPSYPLSMYLLSLNHLVMMPAALYVLYEWKPVFAMRQVVYHMALLVPVSYVVGYNVNCVSAPCVPFIFGSYYALVYPALVVGVAYLTNRFLIYIYRKG